MEALALRGKLAIANARIAYQHYNEVFSGERWEALEAKGALPQRCLWASTSTKNPEYRDVMYVEELIGPDTVNTMPKETVFNIGNGYLTTFEELVALKCATRCRRT